jgi:hypothetical protein
VFPTLKLPFVFVVFDFATLEANTANFVVPENSIAAGVARANLIMRSVTLDGVTLRIIGIPQRFVSTSCKRHGSPKKFGGDKCFKMTCDKEDDFEEVMELREMVVEDSSTLETYSVTVKEPAINELWPALSLARLRMLFTADQVNAFYESSMHNLRIVCDVFIYKNFTKVTYTLRNCRRVM